MSWAEKASKTAVGGGIFLKIANGLGYDFLFDNIDSENQDEEVEKPNFKGDGTIKKWWYQINLSKISVVNTAYATVAKDELIARGKDENAFDKILSQEIGKTYTLELPASGRKALGDFICENNIESGVLIRLVRTGTGYGTKYGFSTLKTI